MRFVFDGRKAAQAARYLIELHDGAINYMVLLKLLYLADRRSLIETGMPITGDKMVAMPNGPVLSGIYDQINMGRPVAPFPPSPWYDYITEPTGYSVSATDKTDTDQLSQYELMVLTEIHAKFGGMNKWRLVDYTHTLPEWDDPHGSSFPIEPERILRACGKSNEEIEELCEEAEEIHFLEGLAKITH